MNTDKRHLLIEGAIALFAVTLWKTTLYLLGVSSLAPTGVKTEIGSFIVLLGCFALARPVVSMTLLLFRSKSVPPAADLPKAPAAAGYSPRSALFRPSASRFRRD
jgi:hypothetical protein